MNTVECQFSLCLSACKPYAFKLKFKRIMGGVVNGVRGGGKRVRGGEESRGSIWVTR